MKAILIARVSTEEQKEAGNSLPAQIARLEKYCQNKNFKIEKVFSFDESAYKDNREEFDRILDYVIDQKEKVAVCCDKIDRLSRNVFDKRVSTLYERALEDKLELHFVSDGQVINSRISAVEKFQFSISLGLAKYYSDAISDNVKRSIEQKLRKGEWIAKAPFGYKNINLPNDLTDIVVDEYVAGIIKKVFELYATETYSLELICKKLKEEHGINWPKGYLGKVLNNPFYHGVMIVKGQEYPHKYPPIISKDLFEQVQHVKDGFVKKPARYGGLPYVYRGLMRCADCGLAITAEKHKGIVYYHCTQYNGKHGAAWFREDEITNQLGKVFKNLQMPAEVLERITGTLSQVHENKVEFHNREFDKLTNEQKTLTRMLDNLYLDKLKGRISDSDYDRYYSKFKDQETDISIRLEKLKEAENNYYVTAKYLLELANRAYELFMSSKVDQKRQLIKLVLSNLTIQGEKLVWEAHKPFDLILECSDRQVWRPH